MKLLVAEDEYEISKAVRMLLERSKYTVDSVDNGNDAIDYILSGAYDGVILDIMMPGKDGLQVLRELRENHVQIPVMLLTARSALRDRVSGLDAGADDYLPKPFAATEFLARVRAMLRRREVYTHDTLTFGGTTLNCSSYELFAAESNIHLNNKEFQILELLFRNPQTVFSTQQLMEQVWGWDSEAEIHVVWTNIANLRRKLLSLDADVEIRSARGVGYCLDSKCK